MEIMNTCGNCHEEIAKTYFDTYHGKVSQLGYSKTAKCYDCHGAHDILQLTNPEFTFKQTKYIDNLSKMPSRRQQNNLQDILLTLLIMILKNIPGCSGLSGE